MQVAKLIRLADEIVRNYGLSRNFVDGVAEGRQIAALMICSSIALGLQIPFHQSTPCGFYSFPPGCFTTVMGQKIGRYALIPRPASYLELGGK